MSPDAPSGEALTYLELSKRGLPFPLASGKECSIPKELVILATMNPLDRGVDEVDAALERRFAKDPHGPRARHAFADAVRRRMADDLRERVVDFFTAINKNVTTNPFTCARPHVPHHARAGRARPSAGLGAPTPLPLREGVPTGPRRAGGPCSPGGTASWAWHT